MYKKIVFLLVAAIAFSSFAVSGLAAVKTGSTVTLDGKILNSSYYLSDDEYYSDIVYLPLRSISEALGYKVEWSSKDKAIVISNTNKEIFIDQMSGNIKSFNLKNNSVHDYYMALPVVVKNVTYIEQNFFMEEFNLSVDWDRTIGDINIKTVKQNSINIINRIEKSESMTIKTTLQYPEIDGLEDKNVQNKINSIFKKAASDAQIQGMDTLSEIIPDPDVKIRQFEVYFNYHIKYNQNGLFSITFENYRYTGGAHGSTIKDAYTFNLKDGTQYKLSDMFKDKVDYVSLISNFVKKQINKRDIHTTAPFLKIDDEQEFYIDNNGIKVYFQQYAIGAYALGILEFGADYDDVRDVLNTELGI